MLCIWESNFKFFPLKDLVLTLVTDLFAVKNSLTSIAILWNLTHPYETWSIERGSLLQKRVGALT